MPTHVTFHLWLQEEIESFAREHVEKLIQERFSGTEYVRTAVQDVSFGELQVVWHYGPGWDAPSGTECLHLPTLLRNYMAQVEET